MDTIDAQAATGHADGGGEMTPSTNDMDAEVWKRIDDVGHAHHIVVWMAIQELEREGVYPINTPATQRRLFRWTGEYPKKNRVNRSIERLDEHDIIGREGVDEWPHGKHNYTTTDGYEIARQIAIKWLHLLDCEDRKDLREIDPEAEAFGESNE